MINDAKGHRLLGPVPSRTRSGSVATWPASNVFLLRQEPSQRKPDQRRERPLMFKQGDSPPKAVTCLIESL